MTSKKTSTPAVKTYENLLERIDYSLEKTDRAYESTEFRACTFNDISGVAFTDCLFSSCNLSNAQVSKAKAQDLTFRDCKLIGINFYQMLDFGFSLHFENCLLDYASFDKKKMNKSSFKNCKLHGVNFSKAVVYWYLFTVESLFTICCLQLNTLLLNNVYSDCNSIFRLYCCVRSIL